VSIFIAFQVYGLRLIIFVSEKKAAPEVMLKSSLTESTIRPGIDISKVSVVELGRLGCERWALSCSRGLCDCDSKAGSDFKEVMNLWYFGLMSKYHPYYSVLGGN